MCPQLLSKPKFSGVEKIKTIGSTYMAATGLNVTLGPECTQACFFTHLHTHEQTSATVFHIGYKVTNQLLELISDNQKSGKKQESSHLISECQNSFGSLSSFPINLSFFINVNKTQWDLRSINRCPNTFGNLCGLCHKNATRSIKASVIHYYTGLNTSPEAKAIVTETFDSWTLVNFIL